MCRFKIENLMMEIPSFSLFTFKFKLLLDALCISKSVISRVFVSRNHNAGLRKWGLGHAVVWM